MHASVVIPALALPCLQCLAVPTGRSIEPRAVSSESALVNTSNYLELRSMPASRSGSKLSAAYYGGYGLSPLVDIDYEVEWAIDITFGEEEVTVILDTGSSDTWLVLAGFQCVNETLYNQSETDCAFGPVYNGTFEDGEIANENFNITYGDGEFLTGNVGYSDITVAGITVKHQEVALVNKAYWNGDGVTSGLMGLAYSALTSAYAGNNPAIDNNNITGTAPGDQEPYSPIVQSMISQGLIKPFFSLALERTSSADYVAPGGYIAFGGLPPVAVQSQFVSTPILIHEFYEYSPLDAVERGFYTIAPEGYVYSSSASSPATFHSTPYDAIVDSGTTLLYVPTPVYDGYLASFDPAPTLYEGSYFYPCNARAPYLGITIAGYTFSIDSADIIVPDSGFTSNTTGVEYCLIGVQDGGDGVEALPIFGDVFLKNVVAVFDVGASLMRFAQHIY